MSIIVTLIAAGFALILVEIFLPGLIAGILGAVLLLIALVVAATRFGADGFLWTLAVEIALGSIFIALWMKYFPRSGLGRRFSLPEPEPQEASTAAVSHVSPGDTGITLTPLRPAGIARIHGHRVDVVAEGTHLDAGTEVTVVKAAGPAIFVRKLSNPQPE